MIQRVKQAQVCINGNETRQIGRGLMVLVGVEDALKNPIIDQPHAV